MGHYDTCYDDGGIGLLAVIRAEKRMEKLKTQKAINNTIEKPKKEIEKPKTMVEEVEKLKEEIEKLKEEVATLRKNIRSESLVSKYKDKLKNTSTFV